MEEFVSCEHCDDGYRFTWDESNHEWIARKCACLLAWQREAQHELKLKRAGLPESIKDYDLIHYKGDDPNENIKRVRAFVDKFEGRFRTISLYLWSVDNGTQKTTVAQWIASFLLRVGFSALFMNMNELVEKLMKNYYDNSFEEEIERARSVDLLVVDDVFDTKKVNLWKSGYQLSYIDTFFRVRLEQRAKATIFTSNIPPHEIKEYYTASIGALIERNVFPMEFTDVITGNHAHTGVRRIEDVSKLFED